MQEGMQGNGRDGRDTGRNAGRSREGWEGPGEGCRRYGMDGRDVGKWEGCRERCQDVGERGGMQAEMQIRMQRGMQAGWMGAGRQVGVTQGRMPGARRIARRQGGCRGLHTHTQSRILGGIRHKTPGATPHGARGKSRMDPQGAGWREQDNPAVLPAGRNLSVPSRVIYNIYCIFIIIAPAHGIYSCTHNPERERTRDRKILKYFYRVFVPVGSLCGRRQRL